MYLKSLKLAGFKSFADRTVLEFGPGVSVVVGPNGTGKSNIVDAVAWVLGSQFPKALRTDRMDDVVFAGTATRPRHSRAEVTVVLDNRDRVIPLDLDEVSITRRLFLGGHSDYEVNGAECRLLDIQELLSDGGVGRRQHLIVGQGKLESILTGKGDERRAILEEAAGILKHRIRKAKALRRLERADADVLRLVDIVREIERLKRPLRRQARDAVRHEQIRTELRSLRLWLGGEDLRRLYRQSRELSEEQISRKETVASGNAEMGLCQDELALLSGERSALDRDLERATAEMARLNTLTARFRGIARVAEERGAGLTGRMRESDARRRRVSGEIEQLTTEVRELIEGEEAARVEMEDREAELRLSEERMRTTPADQASPAQAELAVMSAEIRSLEASVARDARAAADLGDRIESAKARRVRQSEQAGSVNEELRVVLAGLDSIRSRCEATTAQHRARQAEWEKREAGARSAEAERIRAVAKVEALEAATGLSGIRARERLEAAADVVGVLSRLLNVPDDRVDAVDAALGGWAEALVFEGPTGIRRVIALFKSEGRGGVPLVARPVAPGEAPARAIAREWGVEALLDSLGTAADLELATGLIGDVVVVEAWATGWDIVRRVAGIRAVTPEGDLVTSFGVRPADPGVVSTQAIEAARRAAEAAESGWGRARKGEIEARTARDEARRRERVALEELARLESRKQFLAGESERLDRLDAAVADEISGLEIRLATSRAAVEERDRRRLELLELISAARDDLSRDRDSRELLARERAAVEARHTAARGAWEGAVRSLGAAVERRRWLEERLEGLNAELEGMASESAVRAQLDEARSVEGLAWRAVEVVGVKLGDLAERRRESRSAVEVSNQRLDEVRGLVAEVSASVETARDRLGELAVATAELRMREESVAERLRREADATVEQALAAARAPLDGDDPGVRADSLAAELARMGPINLLATEEFRELDERYRLLSDQLSDLERSRSEITKAIAALDAEMETLFRKTFEEAAHHYRRCFTVLFPGGTGHLVLTDPDRPLEAAVEIEAQPLGKKIGKLALLSGGERSLAALAFLFAVFKARPGPMHILDEVDAALDDANLRRFLRLVDDFRDGAQLIIVSHQQATMRVADTLYGVTMEPGGSSQALMRSMAEVPALAGATLGVDSPALPIQSADRESITT